MKALKAKRRKGKYKPEATPSTTIFRKGSASSKDDLNLSNASSNNLTADSQGEQEMLKKSQDSLGNFNDVSGWACMVGVAFVVWVWPLGWAG